MYLELDYKRQAIVHNDFCPYRSDFRRDYARLIHSPCFRRLQGKTQLYPYTESDFFRNRLTHSIEVAQIAKSIAMFVNHKYKLSNTKNEINLDLVEFAGLAHDIGHPPFGHFGEKALDEKMFGDGGFEGNAQTLRTLAVLEKKVKNYWVTTNPLDDKRIGLNLTYRSLASILKYDEEIKISPKERTGYVEGQIPKLVKGYYNSEKSLVDNIKKHVTNSKVYKEPFKTIECFIMELADDIVYATYDLEDALKANFINPIEILYPNKVFLETVILKVEERLNKNIKKGEKKKKFNFQDIHTELKKLFNLSWDNKENYDDDKLELFKYANFYQSAKELSANGFLRIAFSSTIIDKFINAVKFKLNKNIPALSEVYLVEKSHHLLEYLKIFMYEHQTSSPKLRIADYRGKQIVSELFDEFSKKGGEDLLPTDCRYLYNSFKEEKDRKRVICDFIAGMTDRYALEFYGRLKSEDPQTIFKPI